MANIFNNINLLRLLLKWKIHILIALAASVLLSYIFSGPTFITPKFRSSAVLYPANIAPFSEESETEQLLELLNSVDIKFAVITSLNLYKHYGIDTALINHKSLIEKEFAKNVKIDKTINESVKIEVFDKDPVMAYNIVNAFINKTNEKARQMFRDKANEYVQYWERRMTAKKQEMDSLKTCLDSLRVKNNIAIFDVQIKEASRQYFTLMKDKGEAAKNSSLAEQINKFEAKGAELFKLEEMFKTATIQYLDLKKEYDKAYGEYMKDFSFSHIVASPNIPDEKAYPIRWLIVMISLIATFVATVVVIAVIEQMRAQ